MTAPETNDEDARRAKQVLKWISQRGQEWYRDMDEWLTANEHTATEDDFRRVGIKKMVTVLADAVMMGRVLERNRTLNAVIKRLGDDTHCMGSINIERAQAVVKSMRWRAEGEM